MSKTGGKRKPPEKPGPAPPASGLRSRQWRRFLGGPDPVLLDELYVPALTEAVRYDRCCAYFSSTVLAAAAMGFGRLIERLLAMGGSAPRPAVRLVVNEELVAEDVRAMMETGDTAALEEALKRRLKNPRDVLERRRLAMLGWLVKERLLEVRVGVMRHGTGIVHAKFGIMTDPAGDAVVFNGSGNESAKGLTANYEQLEVSTSWGDPDRLRHYADEFRALWTNQHADVYTVTLPEALRLKLIRFAPKEPPVNEPSTALARQKAAMIWRFITEAPYLPGAAGAAACDATAMVDLWPHQRHVVEEAAEAWPDGRLLCDEVGMGKTIEAVCILRRLVAGRGVRRALLLVPAGLLKQWQAELREKGGMVVPRLEDISNLVWPDETAQKVQGLEDALRQDILLLSRETARTERNLPAMLAAEPWDLVLLDEAHAARRARQVEGEFNAGNLLLDLVRQLQLHGRARGFLFLSATPMQTQAWEPWDLLAVLGEGGAWLSDFDGVRSFYQAVAGIRNGRCSQETAGTAAALIAADENFPDSRGRLGALKDARALATQLAFTPPMKRDETATWLRRGSPLARRMHRNSRATLRQYFEMGLLPDPPPRRKVDDIEYDYADARERAVYNAITGYIERRFEELEREKGGKGFVMTVYRRRAASCPRALRESLGRRKEGLDLVIRQRAHDWDISRGDVPEAMDEDDLPEGEAGRSAALPDDPNVAQREKERIEGLLDDLNALGACDTKRDTFFSVLRQVTDDGRPALVFTEYVDTLEYLRDALVDHYGRRLGCYSGAGGAVWDGTQWKTVTKDAITRALQGGELAVLICTDAASEGLNLQAAGAVINYDLPWNPSKVEQRIGRIDRIGQKYPEIRVINLFLKDSVDEQVYTALRRRCGLFEHFVGTMQPVLARARRMLMGGELPDLKALSAQAGEAEQDLLAHETYLECEARAQQAARPAVSRGELDWALDLLTGEFGARTSRPRQRPCAEVSGLAGKRLVLAPCVESLEADRAATPLSPLELAIKNLAGGLVRPGERLPLVVGSHQEGAFRCSVAYWVGASELTAVDSLAGLRKLVESWDGQYPLPEQWRTAEATAAQEAAAAVRRRIGMARAREQAGLRRQLAACRMRLLRELGRYLVCVEGTAADLNGVFQRQLARDIAGARRLQECQDRLGAYPVWPPEVCSELETFYQGLTDNERDALLLGSRLDAALNDPRWASLQALHRQ
jgi:superfamily II DNA or RNA helicase